MEALFLYFGKLILCSAVMWAYYLLFLKDKSFHHYNRFYLLAILAVSIALPLLKVEYFTIETDSRILLLLTEISTSKIEIPDEIDYVKICFSILAFVSFLFLLRLIWGLYQIQKIKHQYQKQEFQDISFYQTDLHNAPFSFFRSLFWKKSIDIHSDMGKQILKHEMVHIEQKHSWDKLLVGIMTALFWFNPVFYFIKKEIHLIHEYLADKKAVKENDTRAFAQMLLASNFSGIPLPATSPFLSSNLKKQLQMLKNTKTKYSYARRIWALPLLFVLAFIYVVNAKNKEIKKFNQEISKLSLSQKNTQKDTMDIQKELRDAKESEYTFIVSDKEVSKSEFLKYVEENEKKDLFVSISRSKTDGSKTETKNQKIGYFYAGKEKEFESNKEKISTILRQKNTPLVDFDKNTFSLKQTSDNLGTSVTSLEKNTDVMSREAESAAKEAEKLAKAAELVAKDAEKAAEKAEKAAKEMKQSFNFNQSNKKSKSEIESELAEIKRKKAELEKERAELWKKQNELLKREIDLNINKINAENFSWSKKPNINLIPKTGAEKFNTKIQNQEIKIYVDGVESNKNLEEINK